MASLEAMRSVPTFTAHVSNLPKGATVERGARVTFKTAPDQRNPAKLCAVEVRQAVLDEQSKGEE